MSSIAAPTQAVPCPWDPELVRVRHDFDCPAGVSHNVQLTLRAAGFGRIDTPTSKCKGIAAA